MTTDLGPVLNAAYPQVVATLVRVLGDMDRAMDAAQDALVKALQVWAAEGVPENPVAWLVTVGRNRAVDQLRREAKSVRFEGNVVTLQTDEMSAPANEVDFGDVDWLALDDDLLRLLFTCCHPALAANAQIVLMLKVVLGFSTAEIARALLASPASIEKRVTRAKAKLKTPDVDYELPSAEDMPARLAAVLKVIYVLYNEGYSRIEGTKLSRGSVLPVAIRLGRMVCRLFRHDPNPRALLALMLLNTSRIPARVDINGVFVPLDQQDRSLWDRSLIQEELALIDAVYAAKHLPSAYQIQAAISAIHCQAATAAETDWQQIAALYEKLKQHDTSPLIAVNQAVAHVYCDQAEAAYATLNESGLKERLEEYQPYFAALALAAEHTGHRRKARAAMRRALQLADSSAVREYIQRQLVRLADSTPDQ